MRLPSKIRDADSFRSEKGAGLEYTHTYLEKQARRSVFFGGDIGC